MDVLIGKPDTAETGGKIETLLEQLRLRQLSLEQVETYAKQVTAAEKLRALNEAQATAAMQTKLTNSLVQVRIVENEAEAQLAKARKEAEQKIVTAQAESQQRILAGRGEGAGFLQEGSVGSFGPRPQDPVVHRPPALRPVDRRPEPCSSSQPLVPERVFIAGGGGGGWKRPFGDGLPSRDGRDCRHGTDGHAAEPAGRGEIRLSAREQVPAATSSRSFPRRSPSKPWTAWRRP